MSATKILFIYPNQRSMSLVPSSISLLSQILKNNNFDIDIFDSSQYLIEGTNSDELNEKALVVRPTPKDQKIKREKTNVFDDLNKKVETFKPTLLAVSATESTFNLGLKILQSINHHNILTILGGVFATFAPEKALSYPEIDILCVGEGEHSLLELCKRLENNKDYSDIKNLWIKKQDGEIIKNPLEEPVNLDENPIIDLEGWDEKRLYRMMAGKVYKMIPVETHRGCPYTCTYCDSPQQNKMYWDQTHSRYFRKKSFDKILEALIYYKNKWKAEYFFFWADTFFTYTEKEIDEFCEMYEDIKIPFYCQARPETISEYKIKKLKDVGCHRVGVGIEHGNEKFRKEVLLRKYTNEKLLKSLDVLVKHKIPFSVNNIIGLPDETPELARDTIELNSKLPPVDSSCSIFQPYHGTRLRELSIERGYITDDVVAPTNADYSILNMPQFPKEKISGMRRTFNMYVKFPRKRWDEIRQAEDFTPEGNALWQELREEYVTTFFKE